MSQCTNKAVFQNAKNTSFPNPKRIFLAATQVLFVPRNLFPYRNSKSSTRRKRKERSGVTGKRQKMNQDAINANYLRVGNVIKTYGKPNATFPADLDITYGELLPHVATVSGVLNILKTMKQKVYLLLYAVMFPSYLFLALQKKMIDYRDPMINDKTVLTLISDWDQDFKGNMVLYDQIASEVKGEYTGQQKVGGW